MSLVLIVDDHEDTCRAMQRLIRKLGPDAECVMSGQAALAFLAERRPELVLLDVTMPEMDGFETLERLRRSDTAAGVPVVMFSAIADERSRQHALELGANDYWVKGTFDWSALRAQLDRFLPNRPDQPGHN